MIIDKNPLPDDPTPLDPPPSYEELQRVAQELTRPIDRKATYTQPSSTSSRPLSGKRLASSSKKPKWFNPFGQAARTSQEVKSTILNLVRDVVRVPDPTAAISILRNCSEACETHGLQFSVVLQEKSVEGHTPIYWAIVKRPPQPTSSDPDLVSALLSLAAPLNDTTLSEIRLACLQNSDQILFQRLRRLPAFAPLSGPDEILLGGTVPPDDIGVQDVPGGEGAFIARFVVPLFQKRMRITKSIQLEFIARSESISCPSVRAHRCLTETLSRSYVAARVHHFGGTEAGMRVREGDLACPSVACGAQPGHLDPVPGDHRRTTGRRRAAQE